MHLTKYSTARTEKLNKMTMPDLDLPVNLKILWIETVDKLIIAKNIIEQFHHHTFYEIHFVFRGNVSYECNNNLYKLSEGQAIIIPAFKKHRYISCSKDFLKTAIAFSIDETVLNTLKEDASIIEFDSSVYENINHILGQIDADNVFIPHVTLGRTVEILYSVFKELSVDIPRFENNPHDPRFLVAKAFIENNTYKSISCTEVANECCLSTKQLNRIFKTETEKSVSEYINHIKMKQAKKLLLDNQLTIKEICFKLGFENESNFISFFKRHCGLTPGIFRKQMSEK